MARAITSANSIRQAAAQESAAKAAKRAAAKLAKQQATESARVEAASTQAAQAESAKANEAANRAAYLEALRVDAEALGVEFEAYLEQEGVNPDGSMKADTGSTGYSGPMLALVSARTHYQKAANGILCNGDPLATLCGQHERAVTVRALILALQLPGNPYLHLNPGQQSMNLRNKARHALKEGMLSLAAIDRAYNLITAGQAD